MKNKCTLYGGPMNNKVITDFNTAIHKISIYFETDWSGDGVPGTECGYAIYEPDESRKRSFWKENIWDGDIYVGEY